MQVCPNVHESILGRCWCKSVVIRLSRRISWAISLPNSSIFVRSQNCVPLDSVMLGNTYLSVISPVVSKIMLCNIVKAIETTLAGIKMRQGL